MPSRSLRSSRTGGSNLTVPKSSKRKAPSAKDYLKINNNKSVRAKRGGQDTTDESDEDNDHHSENNINTPDDLDTANASQNPDEDKETSFTSCFPSLTFENMDEELSKWTLADLRKALTEQKAKRGRHKSQTPPEIKTLVELIRLDYEKRMLMAALIGGISQTMIWGLVNAGPRKGRSSSWTRFLAFCKKALTLPFPSRHDRAGWSTRNKKLSEIWKGFSSDQKKVFKDPLFFALAKLPDVSINDDDDWEDEEDGIIDVSKEVSEPKVHQLSEADEITYQPIFNELVDVEKLHSNHGKPDSAETTASVQLKSLAAFKKAHYNFATICQRFHIHYHLTALSCDVTDGWMQVYSTNKSFSEWADKQMKLSTKFQYYVHGKTVANEIEKKPPQPVDARRGELTRELNKLIAKHLPGKVFPKKDHPVQILADRGWPVRIVAQPNCSLLPEELDLGFRDCDDLQKKKWLSDIANGLFDVEKIPASELVSQKKQKKRKRSNKKLDSDLNDQDTTTARTSTSTSVTNHENRPNSQNSLSGSTILTTQKTQTESSQQAPRENDKHSDNSDDTVSSDDEES